MDLVVRSERVVLPDGERPGSIHIADGVIRAVRAADDVGDAPLVDAGNLVVMPGLVDTHVHVNEPGRTDWEGFETATRAAAAGGVTTIVDMPLNSLPSTCDAAALGAKHAAAAGKCWVDVGFWAGAVPGNLSDLQPLHEGGVMGFKCFLCESGVAEFPYVTPEQLDGIVAEVARLDALLIVHAELAAPLAAVTVEPGVPSQDYRSWLLSRPREAEDRAVDLLVALGRRHGARLHVVHLASASAVDALRAAQAEGVRISAETCPHYLHFAAEWVPDGATEYKCAPPIRGEANRRLLWSALAEGVISMVVTDHSPSPPDMKCRSSGAFPCAWGGISSLQLGLPVVWSGSMARGGGQPSDIARWMARGPADLVGLSHKGRIAEGCDADLVVWDPAGTQVISAEQLEHRHPMTPYEGERLHGVVHQTWLRGRLVFDRGRWSAGPSGRLLSRGEA